MLFMSHLSTGHNRNVLTSGNSSSFLIFPSEGQEALFDVDVRDCNLVPDYPNNSCKSESEKLSILCSAYHELGNLLVLCDSWKNLVLYDINQNILRGSVVLVRRCFKVMISDDCQYILAADKAGDVYLYDITKKKLYENPILGHVSMLLDMVLTPCSKYIITCDRDEKIRVSHFPGAYQIQSYCLGHTEFVSTLKLLPANQDILLSASGDGTVKFWKYLEGKSIFTLKYADTQCQPDQVEKSELPVVFCDIAFAEVQGYTLSSAIKGLEGWIIMTHKIKIAEGNLSAIFLWKSDLGLEISQLLFKEKSLWLICYIDQSASIVDANSLRTDGVPGSQTPYLEFVNNAVTHSKILEGLPPLDIKIYYKTWYDNIHSYYENKNRRIAEKEMKNSVKRIKLK